MTQAQDPKSQPTVAPDTQGSTPATAKKTTRAKSPRKTPAKAAKATTPATPKAEDAQKSAAKPARKPGASAASKVAPEKPAAKKSAGKATVAKADAVASAKAPAQAAPKRSAAKPAPAKAALAPKKQTNTAIAGSASADNTVKAAATPKAPAKRRAPAKAASKTAPKVAEKTAAPEALAPVVAAAPVAPEAVAQPVKQSRPHARAENRNAPSGNNNRNNRSRGRKPAASVDIPAHVDTSSPGTPNGVTTWQAPNPGAAPRKSEAASAPLGNAAPPRSAAPAAVAPVVQTDSPELAAPAAQVEGEAPRDGEDTSPAKKRRRSRRGGRRRKKPGAALAEGQAGDGEAIEPDLDAAEPDTADMSAPDDAEADAPESPEPKAPAAAKSSGRGQGKQQNRQGRGRRGSAKDVEDTDDIDELEETEESRNGKRKMFVSVLAGEQVEVVLAEEAMVQEYYVEMLHQAKIKGNIYKGVISNVDPNLQAAFVNYGGVKNGFLQIDEVHPEYYLTPHDGGKNRKFPMIQKALKPGQEILVQVVKEPAGTKGAFLTSYLSLPGRFLVLTPGREQIGVSRKVESEEERSRLRDMLEGLTPGKGLGVIVRTVSMGASKTSLQRDLQFLKRLWKEVRTKGQEAETPSLIYQELDLSTRAVRDYLTDDVQEVWVDDEATARHVAEFATLLFPRKQNLVRVHTDPASTIFDRFSIQKQLDQIHSREVVLPSGGRLVFDPTEALTAIDINSGRSGGKSNFEDMAYRTNLEAAKMIPLQLRLRDIGGQVVADFIEMRDRDHWREVEKTLRTGMKGDRARYDVGKVGPFGMLEMVRQRLGSSAISVSTEPCPCCKGTGVRRNMEWQAMQALRDIQRLTRQAVAQKQAEIVFTTERELALYLLNTKRQVLLDLEKQSGVQVVVGASAE